MLCRHASFPPNKRSEELSTVKWFVRTVYKLSCSELGWLAQAISLSPRREFVLHASQLTRHERVLAQSQRERRKEWRANNTHLSALCPLGGGQYRWQCDDFDTGSLWRLCGHQSYLPCLVGNRQGLWAFLRLRSTEMKADMRVDEPLKPEIGACK